MNVKPSPLSTDRDCPPTTLLVDLLGQNHDLLNLFFWSEVIFYRSLDYGGRGVLKNTIKMLKELIFMLKELTQIMNSSKACLFL